jgi:hypothetical protein
MVRDRTILRQKIACISTTAEPPMQPTNSLMATSRDAKIVATAIRPLDRAGVASEEQGCRRSKPIPLV